MQTSATVLLLTQDERLAQAARLEVYARSALELVVARTLDEGLNFLLDERPCAVLAHLDPDLRDDQVSQLLWAASSLPRAVPVVVIGDDYDEVRGRVLFQLGVTDYVGRNEHLTKIAALLTAIAPRSPGENITEQTGPRTALPSNPRLPQPATAAPTPLLPGLQRFPILGEG